MLHYDLKDRTSFENRNDEIRIMRRQGYTLASVADHFDISRERVRQISKGIVPLTHSKTPRRPKRIPAHIRFWKYVEFHEQDECWNWIGCKDANGYGRFQRMNAHVYSYKMTYGDLPKGKRWVCHTCDNPSCVNPLHLYPGDPKENARDRQARGRGGQGKRIPDHMVLAIKRDLQTMTQMDVSRKYGFGYAVIHNIKYGRSYAAVAWYPDTGEERPVVITEIGKVLKVEEP